MKKDVSIILSPFHRWLDSRGWHLEFLQKRVYFASSVGY